MGYLGGRTTLVIYDVHTYYNQDPVSTFFARDTFAQSYQCIRAMAMPESFGHSEEVKG